MDAPKFKGFEIIKAMPQGAMGRVFQARQISLDRIVALKMLPREFASNSVDIEQFISEARITASLKHPNIVRVYDFEKSEEGIYYFVMEFVSGYSVAEWINRKGHITEENSLLVAEGVADALDCAWQKAEIVHCDIKPANVIIDGDGTVKVADLGLARSVRAVVDRAKTRTGIVFGTPNYISPEQSRGVIDLDSRADIYSLGAMLYHCMTGKMPFEGLLPVEVMDRQIFDQIPDPQDINHHISVQSSCLIEKMMTKDREHRQKDWVIVSKDIGRVLNHRMPSGELPAAGTSTIHRSALRGTRPKVSQVPHVPKVPSTIYPDSSAFQNIERKFEEKKKQRLALRSGWLFAGVITLAVLVLVGLMLKSVLTRRGQSIAESGAKAGIEVSAQKQVTEKGKSVEKKAAVDKDGKEKDARGMFDFAKKWLENHPGQYNEAIHVFKKVVSETKGTKYSLMATAEIQKIKELKLKAADDVMKKLQIQAYALVRENKFIRAAELYEKYKGPFARETASGRHSKVKKWRQQARVYTEKQHMAEQQWNAMIRDVADHLINADPNAALVRVQQVGHDTLLGARKNEMSRLETLLTKACRMQQQILNSFRAQKGQEIDVMFVKGSEKLLIKEVRDNHVIAEKRIIVGKKGYVSYPKAFSASDLAIDEKHRRLGPENLPEKALMQGILMVRHGDYEAAALCFAKTDPLLAVPLADRLSKRTDSRFEKDAREMFGQLIQRMSIDFPKEVPSCEVCLKVISETSFPQKNKPALDRAIKSYLVKFGNTEFAKEYEPVLEMLSELLKLDTDKGEGFEPDSKFAN